MHNLDTTRIYTPCPLKRIASGRLRPWSTNLKCFRLLLRLPLMSFRFSRFGPTSESFMVSCRADLPAAVRRGWPLAGPRVPNLEHSRPR